MSLNDFLITAKTACFASEEPACRIELPDGGIEHRYTEGDLTYVDSHVGFSPFAGMEIVRRNGQPIWSMAYHGRVITSIPSPREIFAFLRKALRRIPEEAPLRGPDYLTDGDWSYENDVSGVPEAFTGSEHIYYKGTRCYRLYFVGGDIREDS